MKYTFSTHTYIDSQTGKSKTAPLLNLENQDQYGAYFIDEISNLNSEYLKKTVSAITAVINGTIPEYSFGFEVYNFYCFNNIVAVIDQFDNDNTITTIPISDFLHFLKEWSAFVDRFE